jgi:hypothetical protein
MPSSAFNFLGDAFDVFNRATRRAVPILRNRRNAASHSDERRIEGWVSRSAPAHFCNNLLSSVGCTLLPPGERVRGPPPRQYAVEPLNPEKLRNAGWARINGSH